jgi:hypothetical protein
MKKKVDPNKHFGGHKKVKRPRGVARVISKEQHLAECEAYKKRGHAI